MVGDMFSSIWLDNDDLSIQENKAREHARFYPRDVNEEDIIEEVRCFNTALTLLTKKFSSNKIQCSYSTKSLRRSLNAFFRTFISCSGFSTLFLYQLLRVNDRSVN